MRRKEFSGLIRGLSLSQARIKSSDIDNLDYRLNELTQKLHKSSSLNENARDIILCMGNIPIDNIENNENVLFAEALKDIVRLLKFRYPIFVK